MIWAVNYPAMKVAFEEFDPLAYTGWRFILASLLLVGEAAATGRLSAPPRGSRARVALLALTGVGVYQWFYALGVAETSGFSAALLNSTSPLIAALLVSVLGWERLTAGVAAGTLVAYGGVVLFVRTSQGGGLGNLRGNLLCLAAAACWAVYGVAWSRASRLSSFSTHLHTFTIGTLMLLPYCAPAMRGQDYGRVSALSWTILVLSAALPLVVGFRLWTSALTILGVGATTRYSFLTPVLAGVASAAWTGERFNAAKVLSGAAVLAGLALTRLSRRDAG